MRLYEKIDTALILAGGRNNSQNIPIKYPIMIEAKNKPLLIHIMNIYLNQGVKKFIILSGYKSDYIKNYFETNKNEFSNIG